MTKNVVRLAIALLVLVGLSTSAFAQGTTSSIVGLVVDSTGGVVPGATVIVKNEGTQETYETVSGSKGEFTIPALNTGSYSITVTLSGFKTFLAKGVTVNTAAPASVKATLEVGGLEQTVTVEAAAAMVQTTSSSVASTVDLKQISNLPLVSRNALDFITFLPGVQTAGTARDSIVNGLPQSTINITVDGLNVQDNYLKSSDGFFARMSPRLDAVEEVTVTSAASGADASGQGATQIKFTTRSGANRLTGSVYHYFQNDKLNTNTYFNKRDGIDKAKITLNQYGARFGGAIVIPGLYDGHNKAFFFVNYEEVRQPNTSTLNRTILKPEAQTGLFTYNISGGTRSVNVMTLAAANGQLASFDPTTQQLLADIRASTLTTGSIFPIAGDPLRERYTWQTPTSSLNRFPTVRVDYNLTDKHKLNASFNWNDINARPDTTNSRQPLFPGFPVTGDQISDRYTLGGSVRSTFGKNMVNEFRLGGTGGATLFSPGLNLGMYTGSVANQKGFQLGIGPGISAGSFTSSPSSREASTKVIEDTLTWLKGSHSLTTGFNFTQVDLWLKSQNMTPGVTLDVLSTHPAFGMFTVANFPGATATDLSNARSLYATLTGQVSAISYTARLDEATNTYVPAGPGIARGRQREFDVFLQDNWRVRPDLSVNLGLRYVGQLPFYSTNSSYATATLADAWGISGYKDGCPGSDPTPELCNLFKATINNAGSPAGVKPSLQNLTKGTKAFNTDWNNLAPSIGVNWTPAVSGGWLKKMIGEQGDTAFRAGFARSYSRQGIGDYSDVFGSNPGASVDASRSNALGNIGTGLLLRNDSTLTPGAFTATPTFPMTPAITGSVNMFDPNLQVPYSDTWTAGVQRSLGRKMAIEVRYVGTRSRDLWTTYNYNELNILDNGFLNEFKAAQKNLQLAIAAGKTASFKYDPTIAGSAPLPIYLAYFSGVNPSQAGNSALYTSANFASTNFINALTKYGSNPFTPAGTNSNSGLDGDATRRANALAAGLPRNFFRANPDVSSANVTGYGGYTRYDSLQTEFRRRLSDGLQISANYAFGRAKESNRFSFRVPRVLLRTDGSGGDVEHAFKATYVYDLPFGQGRRFGNSVGGVLDRIIGGWNFSGTVRIQSGRLVDFGNVRVVGMTAKEAGKLFKLRKTDDGKLWMMPQDVIDETIKAFSTSPSTVSGYGTLGAPSGRYFAPANGPDCIESISGAYGECGVRSLITTGPMLRRFDMSLTKQVRLVGRGMLEFRIDALNVFEYVYFSPTNGIGSTTLGGWEVTGAGDENGRRTIQLVSRITW